MALNLSTGLRKKVAEAFAYQQALKDCTLQVYSGTRPVDADTAITAGNTLLMTFTETGGVFAAETAAVGSVQLTGGASGTVDQVYVGATAAAGIPLIAAAVSFNGTLNQTATDLATAINAYNNMLGITAVAVTDTVTLTAPRGFDTGFNGVIVGSASTTITTTDIDFASGAAGSNGGNWAFPTTVDASGNVVLAKDSNAWSGIVANTGTASWFRIIVGADTGSSASSTAIRMDGTIATSGGDITLGTTALTALDVETINTFKLNLTVAK